MLSELGKRRADWTPPPCPSPWWPEWAYTGRNESSSSWAASYIVYSGAPSGRRRGCSMWWAAYSLVTYISFLWCLCCRKWKLPCRGLLTQEGGSPNGSTFKFVRWENTFAQFISICHPVPNLVQLAHKCVEIFLPAARWVIVDEVLF